MLLNIVPKIMYAEARTGGKGTKVLPALGFIACNVAQWPGSAGVETQTDVGSRQALTTASETPERLWTGAMATATAEELAHVAAQARAAQVTDVPLSRPCGRQLLALASRCPQACPCRCLVLCRG